MYKNPLAGHQPAWYLLSPPLITPTIFKGMAREILTQSRLESLSLGQIILPLTMCKTNFSSFLYYFYFQTNSNIDCLNLL